MKEWRDLVKILTWNSQHISPFFYNILWSIVKESKLDNNQLNKWIGNSWSWDSKTEELSYHGKKIRIRLW